MTRYKTLKSKKAQPGIQPYSNIAYRVQVIANQHLADSIITFMIVYFDFDKHSLPVNEQKHLQEEIIEKLFANKNSYAIVNGHTDIRGSNVYNLGLSKERADYVKNLIISHGIAEKHVRTYFFGESQVLKECEHPVKCDDSVHQENRRVEIILLLND